MYRVVSYRNIRTVLYLILRKSPNSSALIKKKKHQNWYIQQAIIIIILIIITIIIISKLIYIFQRWFLFPCWIHRLISAYYYIDGASRLLFCIVATVSLSRSIFMIGNMKSLARINFRQSEKRFFSEGQWNGCMAR